MQNRNDQTSQKLLNSKMMTNRDLEKKKPRILFYVERNLHIPFLEPVHDYLAINSHFELAFSSLPYKRAEDNEPGFGLETDVIRRLKQKSSFYGIPEEFDPDVTVVADACFYPVRNCGKIIDVGHGLISKGFFYKDAPIVRRENLADVICVPGPWHKNILEKNVFVPIRVSGFLKTDSIYHYGEIQKKDFLAKYNIEEGKKIILYAPTFNAELSSIPCVMDRIAELIDDNTVLLIKLHGMTASGYVRMYRLLAENNKNIKLVNDDDFAGAMVCANMMVSDVSSAYVEFMLLDKPIVLFNNPNFTKYQRYDPTDIEYRVRDALIEVTTIEELKLAVKLSFADPDEYGPARKKHAKALSEKIDGNAAKRVAETIEDVLLDQIPEQNDPDELFSIIYQTDTELSVTEAELIVDEIAVHNRGFNFEMIFVGPVSFQQNDCRGRIFSCVITDNINFASICQAVDKSNGQYVVLLNKNRVLPENWIFWMHNYFIYHKDAAAVKSLSANENFHEILNLFDADTKPETLSETAEYFFYCLMGNDLKCDYFDADCLMLKRSLFNRSGLNDLNYDLNTGLLKLKELIDNKGNTSWYALEIFNYKGAETLNKKMNHFLNNNQQVSPVQKPTDEEDKDTIAVIL